jgi:hypothetical protein
MRRGRWTGIAAAVVVAAVAAVTAGCGGGTSNALSLDPIAAAATKTQHAGAARIRFSVAFSSSQLHAGKMLHLSGAGAIDGTSSELTFNLGSLLRQAKLSGGLVPPATMARLAHSSLKAIFLQQNGDYVLYLGADALSANLPGGKHWVELDISKLGKSAGLDLGKLMSGGQLQPSDLLSMLKGDGAEIRSLGPATVDGAATTHYRVTIDVAKALQAKGLSPLLGGMAAAKLPKIPVDVWIGKDGLVHRIALSSSVRRHGASQRLEVRLDVYDYGADVTIAAPPSSDVFDATQLAQQGLSQQGLAGTFQ